MKIDKTKNDIYNIFNRWLKGEINDKRLVNQLKRILGKKWFRFFKGDTLATDYNNVAFSLNSPNNREFLKECMLLSINKKDCKFIVITVKKY
jgi:hypothetical protein